MPFLKNRVICKFFFCQEHRLTHIDTDTATCEYTLGISDQAYGNW